MGKYGILIRKYLDNIDSDIVENKNTDLITEINIENYMDEKTDEITQIITENNYK